MRRVRQGRLDLVELRDGEAMDNPLGQQGKLRSTVWFSLEALHAIRAGGAALDPESVGRLNRRRSEC